MLLINVYSVWNKWVFETVGPSAYTVGYLFLDRNRPVNKSSHCSGEWRMCDCETNCLNSLLHRLSRLSDNEVSLNRQHASSYGMLPAIICSARRWMFSSDVVCCFVRLVCQAGHAYSKTGQMTVKKKYSKSCLWTPARFNFFKNPSRLAAFDVMALLWSSHFIVAFTVVTPSSLYSVTRWTSLAAIRSGVNNSLAENHLFCLFAPDKKTKEIILGQRTYLVLFSFFCKI